MIPSRRYNSLHIVDDSSRESVCPFYDEDLEAQVYFFRCMIWRHKTLRCESEDPKLGYWMRA
jgi:hypothetical protein